MYVQRLGDPGAQYRGLRQGMTDTTENIYLPLTSLAVCKSYAIRFGFLEPYKMSSYDCTKPGSPSTNLVAALEFLPPANKVWGKVMFLYLSVILFMGGVSVQRGLSESPPPPVR